MKRIIITLSMLFITLILVAPSLSYTVRFDFNSRLLNAWRIHLYEIEFNKFASHLGFKESGSNWKIINSIGCIGEFQFSNATLKHLGYSYINPKSFKANPDIFPPELQMMLLKDLIMANTIELKYHMEYIGKEIKGIIISKSGMLGASHLGGARAVKLYLESNGLIDREDMNGTKISNYLKEFSGYNI